LEKANNRNEGLVTANSTWYNTGEEGFFMQRKV